MRADVITKVAQEGRFTVLDSGITFHFREKKGDALEGVFMEDARDPDKPSVYLAERGHTVSMGGTRREHCTIRQMRSRPVVVLLPVACVAYAATALAWRHSWVSAVAGGLIAWFLWRRLPRARFAAYIFFSAMAIRGALSGAWPTLAFAVVAVLALQTPAALAAWPRLRPGAVRGSARMRRS